MSVAEKLNIVSENLPKVFNAGYEKGKNDNLSNKEEQEKTIEITKNGTTEILPDDGKVLSKVSVEVDVPSDNVLVNKQGRFYVKNPVVPEGVTELAFFAFNNCEIDTIKLPTTLVTIGNSAFLGTNIQEIDFSVAPTLQSIGEGAFYGCKGLSEVDLSNNTELTAIGLRAFSYTHNIKCIKLPPNLTNLGAAVFQVSGVETLYIPSTITSMGWSPFSGNNALKDVYIADGFNCDKLDLSISTLYSVETIVSWSEALFDRTGLEPYTLTIGATNIAKLTDEQIAIFTNKNWNLA